MDLPVACIVECWYLVAVSWDRFDQHAKKRVSAEHARWDYRWQPPPKKREIHCDVLSTVKFSEVLFCLCLVQYLQIGR